MREGASKRAIDPFNVADCLRRLGEQANYEDMPSHYDMLCDFVHHNLSSQIVSSRLDTNRRSANSDYGPGMLIIPGGGASVSIYKHPCAGKAERAASKTIEQLTRNVKGAFDCLNQFIYSPYSDAEILERTGSEHGTPKMSALGRNDPCPCGSGLRFKRCCGSRSSNS